MRRTLHRGILAACLGLGLAAAQPGSDAPAASASSARRAPDSTAPPASAPPASAHADGPSPAELAAAARTLSAAGATAGGSYWDSTRGEMVVRLAPAVGSTPAGVGARGAALRPEPGVRVEATTYPLAELTELARALEARSLPDVTESYVDVRAGRVVVTTLPGRTARVAALAGVAGDPRVEVRAGAAEPVRASAGSPLVGGGAACTMGFTGTRRGVPVFLTAGHCGREGTTFTSDGRSAGRVTDVVFPESDYAVGEFEGTGPRGVVAAGGGAVVPVTGSQEAPVGSRVCAMGSASGWACGTVVATGVTVRYGSGTTTQYVRGLTKVDVCRSGGDSGGPWMWGTQAQGLTSGGAGTHGPGCAAESGEQVSYLQPINPVLDATGVVLDTPEP